MQTCHQKEEEAEGPSGRSNGFIGTLCLVLSLVMQDNKKCLLFLSPGHCAWIRLCDLDTQEELQVEERAREEARQLVQSNPATLIHLPVCLLWPWHPSCHCLPGPGLKLDEAKERRELVAWPFGQLLWKWNQSQGWQLLLSVVSNGG